MRPDAGYARGVLLCLRAVRPRVAPVLAFVVALALGAGIADAATPVCVGTTNGATEGPPAAGTPCWTEVTPYPFGSEGEPVLNPDSPLCDRAASPARPCHLTVRSFAFRAWNRGLAATQSSTSATPFGVWIFNGNRWFPDPTFPGSGTCGGDTILWAGKLDYWLIQGTNPALTWASLCRFDGDSQSWQPLGVPSVTRARTTYLLNGVPTRAPGGITSGTCTSWDSCWFLGTYGTILRWNGTSLQDVSPDPGPVGPPDQARRPLLTGFLDAASARDAEGRYFAEAVGATGAARLFTAPPLAPQPGGLPVAQVWTLRGADWTASTLTPATRPLPDDPFRTDLVSIGLDPSGQGWTAGNPTTRKNASPAPFDASGPSPLTPLNARESGATDCPGPRPEVFGGGAEDRTRDSFIWTDTATFPGGRQVLAGGAMRPWTDSAPPSLNADKSPEATLVVADCSGAVRVTRFLEPDPGAADPKPLIPANRSTAGMSVAAPAPNAAWAATRAPGTFRLDAADVIPRNQAPHLYLYTDGQPPAAPRGDDNETRPPILQEDIPIVVFDPGPPPPPPAPAPSPRSRTRPLPPAIFAIKSRVTKGTLVITFRVRRAVMVGIAAERSGRIVATTGLRRFRPGPGRLELKLDPKNWPTKISFLSDAPTVDLVAPKTRVSGTLTLRATARALKGRRITSVAFEYSRFGRDQWTQIGAIDTRRPYSVAFDTTTVPNARYRFRAIAIDSANQSAISQDVPPTVIANREAE